MTGGFPAPGHRPTWDKNRANPYSVLLIKYLCEMGDLWLPAGPIQTSAALPFGDRATTMGEPGL